MSETTNAAPAARTARTLVGRTVAKRTGRLQHGLLDGSAAQQAWASSTLAQLRHGLAAEPGTVPGIWEITAVAPTRGEPLGDEPTVDERAAHTALTLFGVHQQSRSQGMHREGRGLGSAVRTLATAGNEVAVRRRFDAVASAQGLNEVAHHLRGLITQLRAASIPLDYGLLTDDLVGLQHPEGARRVRRRWARDYYWVDTQSRADVPSTSIPAEQSAHESKES